MSAEIVIMNNEAVALAADSAVTMEGQTIFGETQQKIFTSANKLFTLSKYHPVGIMIYNDAIFMGIPWETIIKIYRKKLGTKKYNTLQEYASNFIEFLDNGNILFHQDIQRQYFIENVYSYFYYIKSKIEEKYNLEMDEKGQLTKNEITKIVIDIINEQYKLWNKVSNIESIPNSFHDDLLNKYEKNIDEAIKIFEIKLRKKQIEKLKKIATSLFCKFPKHLAKGSYSGIVITGFGEKDVFPSLECFIIEGIVNNKLKYKKQKSSKIDFTNRCIITPFAQQEVVSTFIEGIDPSYEHEQINYLKNLFNQYSKLITNNLDKYSSSEKKEYLKKLIKINKELIKDFIDKFEDYKKKKNINPITKVVSILPKEELAKLAEALVSITSIKRKFTMESETVGGPIDVAVISKGDGFVWIKRKHYFKQELNPHFAYNYFND